MLLHLRAKVIDAHVHVPLQQDGLNPRDVACVVVDDHLYSADVKEGVQQMLMALCKCNNLI